MSLPTYHWHPKLGCLPVHKDPFISKHDEDGQRVLARVLDGNVLVHPDHWDEFMETFDVVGAP